jgi:hypothetical protein
MMISIFELLPHQRKENCSSPSFDWSWQNSMFQHVFSLQRSSGRM